MHLAFKNIDLGFFSDKKIGYTKRACPTNPTLNFKFLTTDSFVERAKLVHGNLYDYSNSIVKNSYTKINIHCNNCDVTFHQTSSNHIYNLMGCVKCYGSSRWKSKGETRISSILEKNQIPHQKQFRFEESSLRYDFYLPHQNILIEYDGEQNYKPINFFGGKDGFKIQQRHDKLKNEMAQSHGIELVRIPFTENNNLETIITSLI